MSDFPPKNNEGEKSKLPVDFQLLDSLVDANPDLNEAEILKLYQQQQNAPQVTVALISDDLNDATKVILASALPEPHDPTSTHSQAQYQIERKLESGGQSHVYLAHRNDGTYKKTVIIKVLNQSIEGNTQKQQLMAEMQILANFKHPNIVSILDAGIDEQQRPWMMLELIQGKHIDQFIQQHQLSQAQLVSIFISLAKALKYIHQNNVVHADIKPANVLVEMLDGQPHPVIIDFGIASTQDVSNQGDKHPDSPYIFATPAFASPEQLDTNKGKIDHRSDIYSMGQLMQFLSDIQGQSADQSKKLDDDFAAIIAHCVATKPEHRYQDSQSLVADLERLQRGDVVSVSHASRSQLLARKALKYKWQLSLTLLTTLISIGLLSHSINNANKNQALIEGTESSQFYWKNADEISSRTRLIYAQPKRNIEPDFKLLNQKYSELLNQFNKEPTSTQTLSLTAMADAGISLGQFEKAHELLITAHKNNPDDIELKIKLGKNYLVLYQNDVQALQNFASAEQRQIQRKRLQQKYFNPALALLSTPYNATNEDPLIPSLLNYFDGNYEQALQQLHISDSQILWPIERLLLSAQIIREQANEALLLSDADSALPLFKQSLAVLNQTKDIARSHPEVYKQLCQTENQIQQIQNLHNHSNIDSCDALLEVLPETAEAILVAADAYAQLAMSWLDSGQSPKQLIQKSRKILNHPWLEESEADFAHAEQIKGHLLSTEGKWQLYSNQEFTQSFEQAIEHHQKSVDKQPNSYSATLDLATAWYNLANNARYTTKHSDHYFNQTTQLLSGLLEHADSTQFLPSFLVRVYTDHAFIRYQNGLSADPQLNQADQLVKQFQLESPENPFAQLAIATLYWTYTDYLVLQDKNPQPYLQQAIEAFDNVINYSSPQWTVRYNQVSAMLSGVTYYLSQGEQQTDELQNIQQKLQSLTTLISESISLDSHWGYYYNMVAIDQIHSGNNPEKSLKQAWTYNASCVNSPIDGYVCLSQLVTSLVTQTQWNHSQPNHSTSIHNEHIKTIQKGLKTYPNHHKLLAGYGRYLKLLALSGGLEQNQKQQSLKQAHNYLTQATTGNPLLLNSYLNDLIAVESALDK